MSFLTIITRVHPRRKEMVKKTTESIMKQTASDQIQHLLVFDPTDRGIGFPGANALLRSVVGIEGEYVTFLDDDDEFVDDKVVEELIEIIKTKKADAVFMRVQYGENILPPMEEFKKKQVRLGKIGSSCGIMTRELYEQCKEYWAIGCYAADFYFLEAVSKKAKNLYWWNRIGVQTQGKQPNRRGAGEKDDIIPHVEVATARPGKQLKKERPEPQFTAEFHGEMKKIDVEMPKEMTSSSKWSPNPLKINIVIPTLGTRDRIYDTIDTLLTSHKRDFKCYVLVQDNRPSLDRMIKRYRDNEQIEFMEADVNKGWVWAINECARMLDGCLFYAADDILFLRDTLSILEYTMQKYFPDTDGVVFTSQTQTHLIGREGFIGAFGLIGDKFLNRFPNRAPFCPDYWGQWSDAEFRETVFLMKKCVQAFNAKLIHMDARKNERDYVSQLIYADSPLAHGDYMKRREKGWHWGMNFDRLYKCDYWRRS